MRVPPKRFTPPRLLSVWRRYLLIQQNISRKTNAAYVPQRIEEAAHDTSKTANVENLHVRELTRVDVESPKQSDLQGQQGKLPELSAYLERRLQEFKEDPSTREIKKDLFAHAKMLRRDPDQLDSLRTHNPEVAKQMERLIRQQKAQEMSR